MSVGGQLLILISVAFDVSLVMLGSVRLSTFVPMYHGSGFCCPQLGMCTLPQILKVWSKVCEQSGA